MSIHMQQNSVRGKYEYLTHPADLKVRSHGKDTEQALSNIIEALTSTFISTNTVKNTTKIEVKLESRRLTSLVFDVCQRYLELFDTNQLLTTHLENAKIEKKQSNYTFSGTFVGDLPKNYNVNNPIKAPTYHEMSIETKNDLVYITIVVDI